VDPRLIRKVPTRVCPPNNILLPANRLSTSTEGKSAWECPSKVKGKVFPYSLPSVGPGADPGVQAVSPQVT